MSTPNIPPLFERTYNHLKEAIENQNLSEAAKTQYLQALDSIRQEVISSPNSELAQKLMKGIKGRSVQAESRLAKRFMEAMESQSGLSGEEVKQRRRDLIKKTVALASSAGVTSPEPKGPFRTHELKEIDAAKLRNGFIEVMGKEALRQHGELLGHTMSQLCSAFNKALNDLTAEVTNRTRSPEEAVQKFWSDVKDEAVKAVIYEVDRDTFHNICQKGNALYAYMTHEQPWLVRLEIDGTSQDVDIEDLYNSTTENPGKLKPWPEKEIRRIGVYTLYENELELLDSICVNLKPDKKFATTLLNYFAAIEQEAANEELEAPTVKFGKAHVQGIELAKNLTFGTLAKSAIINSDKLRNAFNYILKNSNYFPRDYTRVQLKYAFDSALNVLTARVADRTYVPAIAIGKFLEYFIGEALKIVEYQVTREEFRAMCQKGQELYVNIQRQQPAKIQVEINGELQKAMIDDLYASTTGTPGKLEPWPEGEIRRILVYPLHRDEEKLLHQLCDEFEDDLGFVQSMLNYFKAVEREALKNPDR